ncbi:protein SRG1-like [Rutidosis leptorrhynchoides]|uniref:protein SRG1-like n=1 Tax=Rutidosis leptorrhynchoides TaxID=125765 RepID=UPI003A996D3D
MASNTVQQVIINGDINGTELPEKYIYKGNDAGNLDASFQPLDLSIIDVNLLTTSQDELDKLKSALISCDHGLTGEYLNKVSEIGKKFFASRKEVKQKYTREANSQEGYENDMRLSQSRHMTGWIDYILPETLEIYTVKVQKLIEALLKATARSLNLEDNNFLNKYNGSERAIITARFGLYPLLENTN